MQPKRIARDRVDVARLCNAGRHACDHAAKDRDLPWFREKGRWLGLMRHGRRRCRRVWVCQALESLKPRTRIALQKLLQFTLRLWSAGHQFLLFAVRRRWTI